MATQKEKDAIRRELDKLLKSGTPGEKALAQAAYIFNDDIRNLSDRTAALEKKVADLEKKLR